MNECGEHTMVWNKGNPCPYCDIDRLKAAMIDLAKNIGPINESRLKPETREVWREVIEADVIAPLEADDEQG